jgi:hypothetical protein
MLPIVSMFTPVRNDRGCEVEALEAVLPEVAVEPIIEVQIPSWHGRGNAIAAAGVALIGPLEHPRCRPSFYSR